MAENSSIEWTDHTFNPWMGCTKVASGCQNCYAEHMMDTRLGKVAWGPSGTRVRTSDQNWSDVLRWNTKAENGDCPDCNGGRKKEMHEDGDGYKVCERCDSTGNIGPHVRRVFCASLADVFEDWDGPILDSKGNRIVHNNSEIPYTTAFPDSWMWDHANPVTMDDLRRDLFKLIDATPHLQWMILTKRPENILDMWPWKDGTLRRDVGDYDCLEYRTNVSIYYSASDQESLETGIPHMLDCHEQVVDVMGLSLEPLIGPIDLSRWIPSSDGFVDWGSQSGPVHVEDGGAFINHVIVGGESGPGARPCNFRHIRSLVDQCSEAGVPCFVKQLGSYPVGSYHRDWQNKTCPDQRIRDKKGGDWSEWPEDLRVREQPELKS